MAIKMTDTANYSAIADAIRAKSGGSDTWTPAQMPAAIAAIPQGEKTPDPVQMNAHNFFDYDGTLLMSFSAAEVAEMTELPTPDVEHEGLIFDGWNWTLAEVQAAPFTIVGALYKTDDDLNHFLVDIDSPGKTMYMNSGGGVIDWGDGVVSTDETHTYTKAGKYWIKTLGYPHPDYGLDITGSSVIAAYHKAGFNVKSLYGRYYWRLQRVTFPSDCTLDYNAEQIFYYNYALSYATFPSSLKSVLYKGFSNMQALKFFSFPPGFTSTPTNGFGQFHATWFVAPPTMTSIGYTGASNRYPCTAARIVVTSDTPPSLAYAAALGNVDGISIYVPDDAVETYKAATNWSAVASKISGISSLIAELTGGAS